MNWTEYKKYHESFMQNNHGSSPYHTFFCILFTVLCAIVVSVTPKFSNYYQYFYEYLIITLPLVLIHTVFADKVIIANITLLLLLCFYCIKNYSNNYVSHEDNATKTCKKGIVKAITLMRSLTYLITVNCILAVDFDIFPRYLAKTEKYGYSLMDTGVGLFMFMSGLVHKSNYKTESIFKQNLKLIVILIVLGISRFITVKQLDYQEHVTEYGVHWNFFFTLATTKTIATLILYLFPFNPLLLAISVLIGHEVLLNAGLENWVFSDELRHNLLSANREGLTSSLGYVAMYLLAVYIKNILSNKTTPRKVLLKLTIYSVIFWLLVIFVIKPASRVLANSSYCIYMSAVVTTVSTILYYLEVSFKHLTVPMTLVAINENGLLYFLSANLLTGCVNLSIRTLLVDKVTAILVLNVYMIATTVIVVFLKHIGIRL